MKSILDELQRAIDAGYRIGAVAHTTDGIEVQLISYPYTDGTSIKVLATMREEDRTSWQEFEIEKLVVQPWRTPATQIESQSHSKELRNDP